MNNKIPLIIISFILCCACKEDNNNQDGANGNACENMVTTICQQACECGKQDSTCFYYTTDGTNGFSSEGEDYDSCVAVETYVYCGGDFQMNFNACSDAMENAVCGEYEGTNGIELPAECIALGFESYTADTTESSTATESDHDSETENSEFIADPSCGKLGQTCPCNDNEICLFDDNICIPDTGSGIRCGLLGTTCDDDRPICLDYANIQGGKCVTEKEKECICAAPTGFAVYSGCSD